MPEDEYVEALKADLISEKIGIQNRKISSIFFGGGTPSLFSGKKIAEIIDFIEKEVGIEKGAEITLEANPGTAEHDKFISYKLAGVNRLSMGVQSFNHVHLKRLGRIHDGDEAIRAFELARVAGFDNINLDLIHGLEGQNELQASKDLQAAISLEPEHISWYQLTIEPNTVFYSNPPDIPNDDVLADIQEAGQNLLAVNNYLQYEISAYCRPRKDSKHNMNYWEFGDYLAIGAGAHGKITFRDSDEILRYQKTRQPNDYMAKPVQVRSRTKTVLTDERPLEFMMNAMRLCGGVKENLFEERTMMPLNTIQKQLSKLKTDGLVSQDEQYLSPTKLGQKYLNNLLEAFAI